MSGISQAMMIKVETVALMEHDVFSCLQQTTLESLLFVVKLREDRKDAFGGVGWGVGGQVCCEFAQGVVWLVSDPDNGRGRTGCNGPNEPFV